MTEENVDAHVAALQDLRDELQENPIEETRLAELYEEVSTSSPQLWNRATAFIECETVSEANGLESANGEAASSEIVSEANGLDEASGDRQGAASSEGEQASDHESRDEEPPESERAVAVVTDVSKLALGWWAPEIIDDCDAMVTVDVHAGLPSENFVALATAELDEQIEAIRAGEDAGRDAPL